MNDNKFSNDKQDKNKQRLAVLSKTGGHCAYCSDQLVDEFGRGYWHIDHVIPSSKGGPDTFENMVP